MFEISRLCNRIAHWPRVDAMYLVFPTWQQLLSWVVAITGGLQLPSLVADGSELAESLSPVFILGLFVGQTLLST